MASTHKDNNCDFVFFSFFTGAGFLDLGFEDAGFKACLANEIDPSFARVYRYSRSCMNKPLPVYGLQEGNVCDYVSDERMLNFRNKAEHLNTHYVVVAPDEDRNLVMQKSQPSQFDDIEPLFFPYSQVEDLYSFIARHDGKMRGVKKDFLLNFMEKCKAA